MTMLIADVASYQGDLTLDELRAAGFTAVNVKVSHGLTRRSVHPAAAGWIARARAAGLGVSTFHWLDASASGAAQATYAYQQLVALGATAGPFAHVVDCESDATEAIYREYVTTMTGLLGRPIVTYTGDWWWQPRGWAGRTPWLWAAPNAGYLPSYPGDTSAYWAAGYGGWSDLAAMQWTGSLSVWGVAVSASAIRSQHVWAAMTGGLMPSDWFVVPSLEAARREFNTVFPNRDRTSDGGIGDQAHATRPSGHNPDESGVPEDYDADDLDEIRARDFDSDLGHPQVDMEDVCQYLLRECRAGRITWIKCIIFDHRIWRARNDWVEEEYLGSNPHDKHLHVSSKPDTASENNTRSLGLAAFVEEITMPSTTEIVNALRPVIQATVRNEITAQIDDIVKAVWKHALDVDVSSTGVNNQAAGSVLAYVSSEHHRAEDKIEAVHTAVDITRGAVLTQVGAVLERLPAPTPTPTPTSRPA